MPRLHVSEGKHPLTIGNDKQVKAHKGSKG